MNLSDSGCRNWFPFGRGLSEIRRHSSLGANASQPLNLYEGGKIDLTEIGADSIDRALVPGGSLNRDLRVTPQFSLTYLAFNVSQPPFDDPKVRQALVRAVDREKVARVMFEGKVELQMRSEHWSSSERRFTLEAAGKSESVACAAYLPPHAEYSLTPLSGADVAYARALPTEARAPAVFSTIPRHSGMGSQLLLDAEAYAQRLRLQLWYAEASVYAADLPPASRSMSMSETLVHVRSTRTRAVTVEASGLSGTMLDSWDTVGLSAGEQARLRLAARASAMSLVVSAT